MKTESKFPSTRAQEEPAEELTIAHANGTHSLSPGDAAKKSASSGDAGFFSRDNLVVNFVIPIALILAAVAAMLAFGTVEPEKRERADETRAGRLKALPPVEVETLLSLEDAGANLSLDVDGTVVPFREARVAAEVAGRIVEKSEKCEAGQYVQAGDLLMRIDATDYELEVERLTRLKEQEYQALKEIDQEMINTKRLLEVAKQDVNLQKSELDRQKAMPKGFSSKAEIDQARRAVLASSQQMMANENQLDLLKQRRVRLEASERLAATQLKGAMKDLERTEIRAPIEGVVVNEVADLNTFVVRGATLVVIDDTSKVEVNSNLRMDQIYWVLNQEQPALDANARGYDLPETPAVIEYELTGRQNVTYRWSGRLLSYNGIGLDAETRTVPVRVVVDDPRMTLDDAGMPTLDASAPALVRGMYVRVRLLIEPQAPLVVIPARALQPGNRVYQFVEDDTVLDVEQSQEMTASTEPGDEKSTSESPSTDQAAANAKDVTAETVFDPSKWRAGRVTERRGIMPLDSIMVAAGKSSDGSIESDDRLWVCEVSDGALVEGASVVISPIGSGGMEMPARAMIKGMQ